jgi:hypothetical protein
MMKKKYPFTEGENQFELGDSIIFPMSVDEYYDTFLKDKADFNITVYYIEEQKFMDVKTSKAKTVKKDPFTVKRKLTQRVPVSGVPFISTTRLEKEEEITRPSKGVLIWSHTTKALDVPMSDCFYQHEKWIILSTSDSTPRCILHAHNKIVFVKSTYFAGQIRTRAKQDYQESFAKWRTCVDKRNYLKERERPK